MSYPTAKMIMPSDSPVERNGLLQPHELRQSLAPGHGMVSLHHLASRAFDAMRFQLWAETGAMNNGIQLTVTSLGDGYRSFANQDWAFRDRYREHYNPITCTTQYKMYMGKKWWKRRGVAMVATPGTSNHGWGLAGDFAVWRESSQGRGDWKVRALASNKEGWTWMLANAPSFGFFANVSSESWHWEYCAGDNLPQRVLDVENFLGTAA